MSSSKPGPLTFSFADMNSDARLRELILYVSDKCADDRGFSVTKLNKILYFADFDSFRQYGEPVTGVEYMRLPQGPVPRVLIGVRHDMEEKKELAIQRRMVHRREQQRPISLRTANLDLFKARDIAIVDDVIQHLWGKTASEVSEESHGLVWQVTADKEPIPYEAALILDDGYNADDLSRAKELAKVYGW